MTPNQRERVYALIAEGLTTPQIVTRMRRVVTPGQVAACRAHATMNSTPSVFEVQGTIVIEALSRDAALQAASSTRRVAGTRVLSTDLSASRLSSAAAAEYAG